MTDELRRVLLVGAPATVEDVAVRLDDEPVEVVPAASVAEAGDRLAWGEVDCVVCASSDDAATLRGDVEVPVLLLGPSGSDVPEGVAAVGVDLDAPADELVGAVDGAIERSRLQGHETDGADEVSVDPVDPDFETLVEGSAAGIYLAVEGRLRYVNAQLAGLLGYERGDLVGVTPAALVRPSDRAVAEAAASPTGEQRLSLVGKRADGTEVGLVVHVRTIEHDGDPAVVGTVLPRSGVPGGAESGEDEADEPSVADGGPSQGTRKTGTN